MKIYTATLIHETNSFSPIPTDLDSYREVFLYRPSTGEGAGLADSLAADINISTMAAKRGHQAHQGLIAGAQPSMPMNREAWACLKQEILADISANLPFDGVVLFLHGAQMADRTDDCEGELLAEIRQLLGENTVVGVSFDLHGNVSDGMLSNADFLVSCQEYPHTDFESRTEHLLDLIELGHANKIHPTTCCQRIPMFGSYPTTRQPMRSFVDRLAALEQESEVLTISLVHGFAWSDAADAGACIIVTCDNAPERAEQLAQELALEFFTIRDKIVSPPLTADEALDEALGVSGGPVVIADTTDNAGGGAPGDSTYLLERIFARGIKNVGVAMIYDPLAVTIASAAGVGYELELRIGGKLSHLSGKPLDVHAKILTVRNDAIQLRESSRRPLGNAVLIEANGVEIVLCSVREQTFTTECFTEMGVNPLNKRLLIVKSHQHFYEDFSKIAKKVIYATPPGVVVRDFSTIPYQHITRPVWPIDKPPFTVFNQYWK